MSGRRARTRRATPPTAFACPDCGRVEVERHTTHDATCPLQIAVERASNDDREWFLANRTAHQRYPPLSRGEAMMMRAIGHTRAVAGTPMVVTQLAPGVRIKHLLGVTA